MEPFPIKKVLGSYDSDSCKADLRAGFNVALLAFPQGMAYALIAGLPIEYGIYGSALAAFFGSLFAGSRFIMLGPTNATAVILLGTFASLGMLNADGMLSKEALGLLPSLLTLSGIILVVAALLRVAGMVQFVSRTVITGYVTAAAILILANQTKNVLGFHFDAEEVPTTAFEVVKLYFFGLAGRRVGALKTGYHFFVPALDNQSILRANFPDARPRRNEPTHFRCVAIF